MALQEPKVILAEPIFLGLAPQAPGVAEFRPVA